MANFGYFKTASGILKCVSIVLIIFALAASAVGFFASEYTFNKEELGDLIGNKSVNLWQEIYLLCAAAFCLCCSIVNLILHVVSVDIYWNRRTAIVDFLYHSASLLLLGSSGVLNVISAVQLYEINCTAKNECQEFQVKIGAGGLSMVAALICGITAAVVLTNRKDVERDGLLSD